MDQRRFILWITLSMVFLLGYQLFVLPVLFPQPPQPVEQADADADADEGAGKAEQDGDDTDPDEDADPDVDVPGEDVPGEDVADTDPDDPADSGDEPDPETPATSNASGVVQLGSMDPKSGFLIEVDLLTLGASVDAARLNDPRYTMVEDRSRALSVVGEFPSRWFADELRKRLDLDRGPLVTVAGEKPAKSDDTLVEPLPGGRFVVVRFPGELTKNARKRNTDGIRKLLRDVPRTLHVAIPELAEELADGTTLANVDWDLVKLETVDGKAVPLEDAKQDGVIESDELPDAVFAAAVFEFRYPEANVVVRRTYRLDPVDPANLDASSDGYVLHSELEIRNGGDEEVEFRYELQGPVGVPLEQPELARKFRDVKAGFLEDDGGVEYDKTTALEVVKATQADEVERWTRPVKYIGIDVQYFAALVMPVEDQTVDSYVAHSEAELIARGEKREWSDISVVLTSRKIELAAGKSVKDAYDLFVAPKKVGVLADAGVEKVLDYSGFPFGSAMTRAISTPLRSVLVFLHDALTFPYWLSVICLTAMVRGLMFPLSLKQNRNMQKMRELQPKLKELQNKYKDDKEKLSQAMMQLYRDNDYNPFAGCLPLIFQLPIFLGLYQTFSIAVELRLAPFLWADDLAAPDALFDLPFTVPFVGWTTFNLLPILTVGLMVVQQKLFMPPPADEQQAMQFKMMNYMMIFMGVIFYRVPAGLCLYFIASSVWGIAERKMLERINPKSPEGTSETDGKSDDDKPRGGGDNGSGGGGKNDSGGNGSGGGGFFARLFAMADEAGKQTTTTVSDDSRGNGNGGGGRKGRSRGKGKRKKSRR